MEMKSEAWSWIGLGWKGCFSRKSAPTSLLMRWWWTCCGWRGWQKHSRSSSSSEPRPSQMIFFKPILFKKFSLLCSMTIRFMIICITTIDHLYWQLQALDYTFTLALLNFHFYTFSFTLLFLHFYFYTFTFTLLLLHFHFHTFTFTLSLSDHDNW